MDFCHSREIYVTNMEKKLLDTATKAGLDYLKTASKKLVHKAAEAAGEFIGNKIADKIVKNLFLMRYSTRKKTRNIKRIKTSIIKWSTIKCLNY